VRIGDGEAVSSDFAYSGTQSLQTISPGSGGAFHLLDPDGLYSSGPGYFPIAFGSDWWIQARVRVTAGGAGGRRGVNGMGWYVDISGSGLPTIVTAGGDTPPPATLGAPALDPWLLMRWVHTSTMGQDVEISIQGDGVSLTHVRGYAAQGPLVRELYVSGDAYGDDTAPVPEPFRFLNRQPDGCSRRVWRCLPGLAEAESSPRRPRPPRARDSGRALALTQTRIPLESGRFRS
jgi:hypothetical protein